MIEDIKAFVEKHKLRCGDMKQALSHLEYLLKEEELDENGLKCCPFCGSEAELKKGYESMVVCTGCGCSTYYPNGLMRTENMAIKAWNTRIKEGSK